VVWISADVQMFFQPSDIILELHHERFLFKRTTKSEVTLHLFDVFLSIFMIPINTYIRKWRDQPLDSFAVTCW